MLLIPYFNSCFCIMKLRTRNLVFYHWHNFCLLNDDTFYQNKPFFPTSCSFCIEIFSKPKRQSRLAESLHELSFDRVQRLYLVVLQQALLALGFIKSISLKKAELMDYSGMPNQISKMGEPKWRKKSSTTSISGLFCRVFCIFLFENVFVKKTE